MTYDMQYSNFLISISVSFIFIDIDFVLTFFTLCILKLAINLKTVVADMLFVRKVELTRYLRRLSVFKHDLISETIKYLCLIIISNVTYKKGNKIQEGKEFILIK